ncbi:GGDEF domain protein [Carboxydothermus hydrogenoformans Z-2901]|uniref:GGDEF domain protein n=1 Tax=Carboxydothermus hydrogenoformans (strain ATCC BAA-161 / DSM 6008 / Z-2901) TaxID=246194 RepID=Q3AFS2_CARHZ|nr:GGDEF domain protein [Carboxydothermus hydrogenoformans Z-2901]
MAGKTKKLSKNYSMHKVNYWQIWRVIVSLAGFILTVFYLLKGSIQPPGAFFALLTVSFILELTAIEICGSKIKGSYVFYLVTLLLKGKGFAVVLSFLAGLLASFLTKEEKTFPGYFFEGAKNSLGILLGSHLAGYLPGGEFFLALIYTAGFILVDAVFMILRAFFGENAGSTKEEIFYYGLNCFLTFTAGVLLTEAIKKNFYQALFLGLLLTEAFYLVIKINQKLLNQSLDYVTLWNISRTFHRLETPDDMLKAMLQELKNTFSYHTGVIYTYSESLRKYIPRYLNTDFPELPGPEFHNTLLSEMGNRKTAALIKHPQLGSIAVVPLQNRRDVFGYLVIVAPKGQNYSHSQLRRLENISGQVALAVYNGYLYLRLKELAQKDELTGLYNRRYFLERLNEEHLRSRRHKLNYTIVLLDIDYFKKINDTYGHDCGDLVLNDFGRFLKDTLRRTDLSARYGGEEFVVLLPQTGKKEAYLLAERLREKVKERVLIFQGQKVKYTVSMGLAAYPEDAEEYRELLSLADKALYQAKNRGRDKVVMVNNF